MGINFLCTWKVEGSLTVLNEQIFRSISTTYWDEFIERTEQLNKKPDSLSVDVGVEKVEELGHLCHKVKCLDVVWLISKVVLNEKWWYIWK